MGQYDFIKLIRFEENRGVGIARQGGVECANGVYLYFLDSDDTIDQDGFIYTVETLREHPETELCRVNCYEQSEDSGKKNKIKEINLKKVVDIDDFLATASQQDGIGFLWRYFFRRSFIEQWKLQIAPIRYAEDFIFVAQCLSVAKNILLCPAYCCVYHRHTAENSITKNIKFNMEFEGFCFALGYIGKFLAENHVSEERALHIEYQILCIAFPTLLYAPFEHAEICMEKKLSEGIFNYYLENGDRKTLIALRYFAKCLLRELTIGKQVVLCPAGHASIKFASFIIGENIPIIAFLDNYKSNICLDIGKKSVPVFHFEEFLKMRFENICIIVNSVYETEIVLQLNKISNNRLNIFSHHDLLSCIQRHIHRNFDGGKTKW